MSKLTQALIPGYGANPTKPTSNPLKGLAPDLETGLPQGLPSGIGKAALKYSNPVGGISPDINGDIGYQKGFLDNSSNGTPDTGPKAPGYNVWADPDMTKRGWGWGMGADGALHTGTMGGGPAGTPWGPQGSTAASGGNPGVSMPTTALPAGAGAGAGASSGTPPAMAMSPAQGQTFAQSIRNMASRAFQGQQMGQGAPGGMSSMGGQPQGGNTGFTGGQGQPSMPLTGGQPAGQPGAPGSPNQGGQGQGGPTPWMTGGQSMPSGGAPMTGGTPQWAANQGINSMGTAQNPQAIQQLIAQMRMQQQAQQPGQTGPAAQ